MNLTKCDKDVKPLIICCSFDENRHLRILCNNSLRILFDNENLFGTPIGAATIQPIPQLFSLFFDR
ncbi:hypothetical protein DERP_011790 [Dermatophagoides pteronyssinus]|uniref:Uncharacterized protein n=1 Tax=Dermatophagoides pteronyssinus TaxID=6956 RepID=A0ABQ8JR26_DERPT|nr:hypothetical protein DERP_011790 [Dermatophagoides pteronyssinus]